MWNQLKLTSRYVCMAWLLPLLSHMIFKLLGKDMVHMVHIAFLLRVIAKLNTFLSLLFFLRNRVCLERGRPTMMFIIFPQWFWFTSYSNKCEQTAQPGNGTHFEFTHTALQTLNYKNWCVGFELPIISICLTHSIQHFNISIQNICQPNSSFHFFCFAQLLFNRYM